MLAGEAAPEEFTQIREEVLKKCQQQVRRVFHF